MARILIIDDDEAVRRATTILLEANGFEVEAVSDGKSGIDAVTDQQFDIVIVDMFMTGMNGLETTRVIRSLHPSLPIIAASGFMFGGSCPNMPEFVSMTTESGATSTLYKPFRPADLLQAIQKAMDLAA